jgi:hypothetical protein
MLGLACYRLFDIERRNKMLLFIGAYGFVLAVIALTALNLM